MSTEIWTSGTRNVGLICQEGDVWWLLQENNPTKQKKKQQEENASESKRRPRDSSREMCVLIAAICWSLLSSFARPLTVQLEKRHPIRRRMAVISICNSTDSIFCPLSQEWLGLIPIITGEEAVNYLFGISTCFLYLMCSLSSTEGAPFFVLILAQIWNEFLCLLIALLISMFVLRFSSC